MHRDVEERVTGEGLGLEDGREVWGKTEPLLRGSLLHVPQGGQTLWETSVRG